MSLSNAELRALIRRSRALDPVQKRAWLAVLPHIAPVHRAELAAILEIEHEPANAPPDQRRRQAAPPAILHLDVEPPKDSPLPLGEVG